MFEINDRVAVTDECEYFKKLRGKQGTVVGLSPKTALSLAMVDVKLDTIDDLESIPFFPNELRLVKRA